MAVQHIMRNGTGSWKLEDTFCSEDTPGHRWLFGPLRACYKRLRMTLEDAIGIIYIYIILYYIIL